MIRHVFEVQRQRVSERVVADGPPLRIRWLADEGVNEIINFKQVHQLGFESGTLFGGEVGFEPEIDVMNHGGGMGKSQKSHVQC